MQTIQFTAAKREHWAGMEDYRLIFPDGAHFIELKYVGEPPHGDSYHSVVLDGAMLTGWAWGCNFAFSACSRYVTFSFMRQKYERLTVVADLLERKICVLPVYIYQARLDWPILAGYGESSEGKEYRFGGMEVWREFDQ